MLDFVVRLVSKQFEGTTTFRLKPRLPRWVTAIIIIFGAFLFFVVIILYIALGTLNIDHIWKFLGSETAVVSFTAGAVTIIRNTTQSGKFNVVFISKSTTPFSRRLYEGLREYFDNSSKDLIDHRHETVSDEGGLREVADRLHRKIKELADEPTVSAIVLRPVVDGAEGLRECISYAISRGVTVVCVDGRLDPEHINQIHPKRLFMVYSDDSYGGALVGDMASALIKNQTGPTEVILLGGPQSTGPGRRRVRAALWKIAREHPDVPTVALALTSWRTGISFLELKNSTETHNLIIFAGSDINAIEVASKKSEILSRHKRYSKILVIGYNGCEERGRTIVEDRPDIVATVDAKAREQGKNAGRILVALARQWDPTLPTLNKESPTVRYTNSAYARILREALDR